jgi:cytidine deaminase
VVQRCLEKNPEQRFHSAHDLAFALEAMSDSAISSPAANLPERKKSARRRTAIAAALVAAALGVAVLAYFGMRGEAVPKISEYIQLSGLYWCDARPDQREFVIGYESNDLHKRNLFTDTVKHLQEAGWLVPEKATTDVRKLTAEALDGDKAVLPKSSQLRSLIEFGRAVHAEMAAIVEAARRGISVSGCTMFVTTFPCHLCARHIVASGILRVRYIEPYAKSLAAELYPDSIAVEGSEANSHQIVFEPFVGIAPRQYMHLFSAKNRKSASGQVQRFSSSGALPRSSSAERVYIESEDEMLATLTIDEPRFQGRRLRSLRTFSKPIEMRRNKFIHSANGRMSPPLLESSLPRPHA